MPIKNIVHGQKIDPVKLARARELRREMTSSEKILWEALRGNKLGVQFRRQQIIAGYIVDFYCHQAELVIEVDGGVHAYSEQRGQDSERDRALEEMGLRVVHIWNSEIERNLSDVVERIRELVQWIRLSDDKQVQL
jgi:very-short-patch-repair endonuclease